jgi:hypothetical protein
VRSLNPDELGLGFFDKWMEGGEAGYKAGIV